MLKKSLIYLILLVGLMLGSWTVNESPALAQEDLDAILARSAAKNFLATISRAELMDNIGFYLADELRVEGLLATLGTVDSFVVTGADWLVPGMSYQVQATLQPGDRLIAVNTGLYDNRWKVDGVELGSTPAGPDMIVSTTVSTEATSPVSGNGEGQLVFQTSSGSDIYVVNADGTGLRRVTHGMDPQLSPDGSQIAFTRWDPQYELFTVNTDGTNERAWFSGRRQMKSPTWSADGGRLIFSYQDGGRLEGDKRRVNLRTAAQQGSSVNVPGNARGVNLDGDVLEFYIPPDAYWWLAEIDLADEVYTDLATGSRYNYAPIGHPSDPALLYYRTDKGIGEYSSMAQTSRPVSFDDRDRGAISISPDGSKAAFTYFQDGNWEIHTINLDGSNRQRLTKTPLYILAGATGGNNEVYVNEEGFRTMSRAQEGTMPNLSWNNAAPVWSPDGSKIAFVTDRTGQWEIWIMNADGSDQRPMFSNGALNGIELDFNGVDERMLSWQ
jgi:Tol biopolymer transport system component